jgi:Gpi18-like mannosyltransferase
MLTSVRAARWLAMAKKQVCHRSIGVVVLLTGIKLLVVLVIAWAVGGATTTLCRWDCEWYTKLIAHGYDVEPIAAPGYDMANWAFFPLYAAIARVLADVSRLSAFWSGTLVSFVCTVASTIVSIHYRSLTRPGSNVSNWIAVMILYPFSIYFSFVYTESLYAVLTFFLLYSLERQFPIKSAVGAGLLAITRPTGVLSFPIVGMAAASRMTRALRAKSASAATLHVVVDEIFALLLMPLGLAFFMWYLWSLVGDAMAFAHVEAAWNRPLGNPLLQLWEALKPLEVSSAEYSALAAVVGLVGAAWLAVRRLWSESWLLAATIFLAFSAGPNSVPRYTFASPVFILCVGDLVDRIPARSVRLMLAFMGSSIQAYFFVLWVLNSYRLI